MTKKIDDKLKEQKKKKKKKKKKIKEKKRFKRAKGTHFTQAKWTFQKRIEKEDKAKFNEAWSSIKVVNERFHNNFWVGHRVHPLGYMGFGLGIIFSQQKFVKQQRRGECSLLGMS